MFSYELGQSPPESQTVEIETTGQPLSFTVSVATSTCGGTWLSASPSSGTASATSNTPLSVSVVTAGMAAGTCTGTITLNYNSGVAPSNLIINVTLGVTNAAELSVNTAPGFGAPPRLPRARLRSSNRSSSTARMGPPR